jgi:hypothetical protein
VAATGADLRSGQALDAIALRFADWYAGGAGDVGIQTSRVLSAIGRRPTAGAMRRAAESAQADGRSARACGREPNGKRHQRL